MHVCKFLCCLQSDLLESQATLEAIRAHHDALLHVWVDARGGVEHLAVMSSHLPLPPGSLPVPVSDDTLPDVLAQVRMCCVRLEPWSTQCERCTFKMNKQHEAAYLGMSPAWQLWVQVAL